MPRRLAPSSRWIFTKAEMLPTTSEETSAELAEDRLPIEITTATSTSDEETNNMEQSSSDEFAVDPFLISAVETFDDEETILISNKSSTRRSLPSEFHHQVEANNLESPPKEIFDDEEEMIDVSISLSTITTSRPINKRRSYGAMLVWVLVTTATLCAIIKFNQRGIKNDQQEMNNSLSKATTSSAGETSSSSGGSGNTSSESGVSQGTGDIAGQGDESSGSLPFANSPTPTLSTSSTTAPTLSPGVATTAPTWRPTLSPSNGCTNQIASFKSCYTYQEQNPIIAFFTQCNPGDKDWVGIYEQGSKEFSLGDQYLGWDYICGSDKDCGGVAMLENMSLELNVFLELGSYQLFLVVANPEGAPYRSVATSEPFEIAETCL